MGGKYEVRWKFNGRCPFWCSVFTNSLLRALWLYVKAVCKGNTRVDLVMHAWKECPADCKNREWLCDARPDNLKPLCHHHFTEAQKWRRNAEKPDWAKIPPKHRKTATAATRTANAAKSRKVRRWQKTLGRI